jgi:hypothetical protein
MNQDNTPNPASFALAHLPSYYYLYGRASPHADEALNALYAKNEPQYQVFRFLIRSIIRRTRQAAPLCGATSYAWLLRCPQR